MSSAKSKLENRLPGYFLEYALVLLGLSGLFFFFFGTTFHAQFRVLEEHLIIRHSWLAVHDWFSIVINDTQEFGRFRPLYYVFHFAKIALFGLHPQFHHVITTSLGVLTCFFFYIAIRKVGADILSSFFFILLFALTGYQNTIWYVLVSAAETLGMVLTSISVWAIVMAASQDRLGWWDILGLTAMTLAGLSKESFILLIPAFLLLRWVLECWFKQEKWLLALNRLKLTMVAGLLIFTVLLLVVAIILLSMPKSYSANAAGLSLTSFDPKVWYQLVISPDLATVTKFLPVCALLLLIYYFWPGRESARPYILAGLIISLVWFIPQLVLYSHSIVERYLFPAIVAPATIIAATLAILWHTRVWLLKILWIIGIIWILPSLSFGLTITTREASRYTAETSAVHKMVTYLAQNVAANQTIILAADPGTSYGFESTYALPVFLQVAGSTSPVYLWSVLTQGERSSIHIPLAEQVAAALAPPKTLTVDQVGGIIMVTSPADLNMVPSWFFLSQWQEKIFTEPYYTFSLQELGYVKAGEVSYRVLTKGESHSEIPTDYPLITVAPSLKGKVGINPLLKTPWWGIEQVESKAVLWLGYGDEQGLHGSLWSGEKQFVQIFLDFAPGPARADYVRTVEFTLTNKTETQTTRQQSDSLLNFLVELQPGYNEFSIKVLDQATILQQPNGDTRPLLVYLRHVTITSPYDQNQAGPLESPLVIIDSSLAGLVGIAPQLQTAPWGIEVTEGHSWLWLGHDQAESFAGTLWSRKRQAIHAIFEVEPGPARADKQRTVELTLTNTAGRQTIRQQFDQATDLVFTGELQPGRNEFNLHVLDDPLILQQSSGDTRSLLVALHQMIVKNEMD